MKCENSEEVSFWALGGHFQEGGESYRRGTQNGNGVH